MEMTASLSSAFMSRITIMAFFHCILTNPDKPEPKERPKGISRKAAKTAKKITKKQGKKYVFCDLASLRENITAVLIRSYLIAVFRPGPEMRVPGHFPQMFVRVGKVSRVAAPKNVLSRFDKFSPGLYRLIEDASDFLLA